KAGLAQFSPISNGNCTKEDLQYRYDFRGDSNFKINSPESNAMIWYQNSIASHCASTSKAKDTIADDVCQNYYRHPFASRWKAAREALAAWIFHGTETNDSFANDGGTQITML